MYIDNSWLHICLLNRQCKREKWVKQEGRDSFCSAVGSTRIWPWFYLKFDDIWLPHWYKFYRMLCAMPMPINRWNQLQTRKRNNTIYQMKGKLLSCTWVRQNREDKQSHRMSWKRFRKCKLDTSKPLLSLLLTMESLILHRLALS